jgi:uncharacterized repeat protein (TIGR03806 family)
VKVFNVAAPGTVATFIDYSAKINGDCASSPGSCGESGLLGMAFHPNFPTTPEVFLSYTATGPGGGVPLVSKVTRITLSNTTTGAIATQQDVISVNQPYSNHNGGDIAFGADGYLYYGLGDGGSGGDPENHAQDTTDLLGSMLRLDVRGTGAGYAIPGDNPFAGNPKCNANFGPGANAQDCPEIYAWGFRNPWRWGFDPPTGQLWVGDVGQSNWEEVDLVQKGRNYGWRCREGAHDYNTSGCPAPSAFVDPVAEYDHSNGRVAITGGYVYRGTAIPSLQGQYIYADFSSGPIYALQSNGSGGFTSQQVYLDGHEISAFAPGVDGELYYADYGNGAIRKLVPGSGGTPDTIPTSLKATGCVDTTDPTKPAAGLIPYGLNAPFWSDGAQKERWLGLPNGQTITVNATTGDWDIPAGSIVMKLFRLNGTPFETRLLMRHPDGVWRGYTYEWNGSLTDATRVTTGKTKLIGSQQWTYPSEAQCLQCHTAAAGFSLGPETAQLNGNYFYSSTGRTANQVATLDHIGVFTASPGAPAGLPALADPTDTSQALNARARAWLHTNCSQCHRPGGPTPSSMDLRYTTALSATNACGVAPSSGDLGLTNPMLIKPGNAANSVVKERMSRRDGAGMPPLGSAIPDSAAVQLLTDWINGLASCN